MGEARVFQVSDQAGLAVAIVLHAALAGLLAWQMGARPEPMQIEPPKGMVVSLVSEVSLESTAPNPVAVARASRAPVIGDPVPESEPVRETETRRETEAPTRNSRTTTAPRTPTSRPSSSPRRSTPSSPTRTPPQNAGGNQFDEEFSRGFGDSSNSTTTTAPGQQLGPSALASLESAVGRQVKRKWQGRVPQGPDAEKLVTRVRFRLNPDGSLKGEPQLVGSTAGVTDLNRNQVGRHREEAVRAIKLVGRFQLPFDVPADHPGFTLRFDRN